MKNFIKFLVPTTLISAVLFFIVRIFLGPEPQAVAMLIASLVIYILVASVFYSVSLSSEIDIIKDDTKKEIASLNYTLKSERKQHEENSRIEIEYIHNEVVSTLFPDKKLDLTLDVSDFERYSHVRRELSDRAEIVKDYLSMLTMMEKGLHEKRYSPYIYTTLAEAYSNRILADYYRGTLKQSETIPPIARISAELQTLYLEALARKLDWGSNAAREKKVASIRDLRRDAKEQIEEANYAKYQLLYLLELYPQLEDVLDMEFSDLGKANRDLPTEEDHDSTRDYLTREEYIKLSVTERNQLALDRYVESRKKSKWQIGRDYELYIGYLCEKENCHVKYTGSLLKLEDLGRDLIVKDNTNTYIIQCKYWSKEKTIHEKHIFQLFGTVEEYRMSFPSVIQDNVKGVFVTSTTLSEKAKLFADRLGITVYESVPIGDFPRIKCNINTDKDGIVTHIYHLPMDLSYDATIIDQHGEFMAMTVKEAEDAGFRRSYRFHGL